jgi:hypothetical protein
MMTIQVIEFFGTSKVCIDFRGTRSVAPAGLAQRRQEFVAGGFVESVGHGRLRGAAGGMSAYFAM